MRSHRASAFQPSTWAEVEDAAASRKHTSRSSDPIVADILSFTNAPTRCIDTTVPETERLPALSKTSSTHGGDTHPNSGRRLKRGTLQIDDVLGIGRIDLEAETFARRYTLDQPAPTAVPVLPPLQPSGGVFECDDDLPAAFGLLNPSSSDFDPVQYLARLHDNTSMSDLQGGLNTLSDVSACLSRSHDNMRASSHANLALATAIVAQARSSAHLALGNSKLLESFGHGNGHLARAGRALDEKYGHILNRQTRIDTLKRVFVVVRRFGWLLVLPSLLRTDGSADIQRVEEAARQLLRAREWRDAQDTPRGPARAWIQVELNDGLETFVDSLAYRLSNAATGDQKNLARLVNVLESVERENVVETALAARLAAAKELLLSAGRKSAVSALVRARVGAAGAQGDVVELISRMSNAFIDGLGAFWDLAKVVAPRPRWGDMVDLMLPTLVSAYAESVRSALFSESQMVTRDAALEIGRAHRRAMQEIRVPAVYLNMLDEVARQVVDLHLSSLARALKASAGSVARACFDDETIGSQLPRLARALVEETVSEVKDLVRMDVGQSASSGLMRKSSSTVVPMGDRKAGDIAHDEPDSSVETLVHACVRVPEYVVHTLRELVTERSRGPHILAGSLASSSLHSTAASSQTASEAAQTSISQTSFSVVSDAYGSCVLGTARCCCEFVDGGGVDSICEIVRELGWSRRLDRRRHSVQKRIRTVMIETVKVYSKRLSPEVRWSARRVAELRSTEGLRTSQSMEIESASAQAVEVLLNVSLAVCRARHFGARMEELTLVEKQLTEQVAEVLLSSMGGSSATTDMAAQIWVDISFLIAVLGESTGAQHGGADKAKDSFVQALGMASAAVRRAGVAFGKPEEETLRKEAVNPSIARARLMVQAMRLDGEKRKVPSSLWVRSAMVETIRLATAPPP
jgi:Exocyst complex component Sec5